MNVANMSWNVKDKKKIMEKNLDSIFNSFEREDFKVKKLILLKKK